MTAATLVTAILRGPQGPTGGNTTYPFPFPQPKSVWTISHNLDRYPSVTIVDSAGDKVEGDVTYLDQNTISVTFSSPFSGTAYLN